MRPIIGRTAAIMVSVIVPTLFAYPTTRYAAQLAADDDAQGDTGIAGQVIIRPIRPHETTRTPNLNPYQATVHVADPSGHLVTTFQSDAGGNFRVALPPGTYVLRPQSPGLYPRASEQTVVVPSNGFTQLRIIYDSGMR
jgi:hypothetical protein